MFTKYLREAVLKHLVDITQLSSISPHLGLKVGSSEVAGGSYDRQSVVFIKPDRSPQDGSVSIRNKVDIVFPTATADWGNVDGYAIYDSGQGGNALVEGYLEEAVEINSGGSFIVKEEELSVGLPGNYLWSHELEEKVLDLVFRGGSYQPAALYFALLTEIPTNSDTASKLIEPTDGGYARVNYGMRSSKWTHSEDSVYTVDDADFAAATEDWSKPIKAAALLDAAQGGTFLAWGSEVGLALSVDNGECVSLLKNSTKVIFY